MERSDQPFWRRKGLDQFTAQEWESLCDGCGQCCLLKLEDEDTGELYHTRLTCRLLDIGACRCTDYENRHERVNDCALVIPDTIDDLDWLPHTCAYRLVMEGRDLYWWHPLVSGDPGSVHEAGISVRGWARSETGVPQDQIDRYVIQDPSRRRPATAE
jgi:uncharacterized cysteine cluster protein YcgN (CxxCxxCC family)